LQLEHAGNLGEGNAGMLIFLAGHEAPEYVPWSDVARVDLDRPSRDLPARTLVTGAVRAEPRVR
jgi:hypothetical protein